MDAVAEVRTDNNRRFIEFVKKRAITRKDEPKRYWFIEFKLYHSRSGYDVLLADKKMINDIIKHFVNEKWESLTVKIDNMRRNGARTETIDKVTAELAILPRLTDNELAYVLHIEEESWQDYDVIEIP